MVMPYVLSIPHCGNRVPDALRKQIVLDDDEIQDSVDVGTHEIFSTMPVRSVIAARWSRLVVDLNRGPDQRDAKGVVALSDYYGRAVYQAGDHPTLLDVRDRLERFHRPYHSRIVEALKDPTVWGLIDCHSLNGTGPPDAPDPGRVRKYIILSNNGDLNGKMIPGRGDLSCSPDLLHCLRMAFESNGFSVALNTPYKGGFIVKHYGRQLSAEGRFAIQIEMNRSLYMTGDQVMPEAERVSQVAVRVKCALEQTAAFIRKDESS